MADDFEIGRVIAVDTAQVTIELNKDLKALTRTTYEGALEVGRINSYLILPVGARRLVAMVTRVVLAEEAEIRADRTMVALPAARRVMRASLIGTLDGRSFTQGVSVFPVLDNPVHLATARDLDFIFDCSAADFEAPRDAEHPGFCIRLGESAIFSGYPIQIDPDALFGKHAAILGSTGSGKSCTIASLIQSILSRQEIHRTNFVILDTNGEFPNPEHALATFLRDVLGISSAENPSPELSNPQAVPPQALPFYDRQRASNQGHHVVIVDLSLLAAEVLENVTALIGRLILEFLQRLGESGGEQTRGSLPVVLVLEEAQNYIGQPRQSEEDSISRVVFERIAREGRKYGLGLVVASQRPSELSKTVLSQCSSFIVHRLQNPEDLRYFKDIVPGIYGPLLDQLPALAPQTALVLGECVRAPALVRVREAQPLPRSRDPRFYRYWVSETVPDVDVEGISTRWEGKNPPDSKNPAAASGDADGFG